VKRFRREHADRVRELAAERRRVLAKVAKGCASTRERIRAQTKAHRASERERINREIAELRDAARGACATRRARVRATVKGAAELARRERDERTRLARELAGLEQRKAKQIASAERRGAARERRRESDEDVIHNIDPGLVPVWRKVRKQIQGSPKRSRTEEFLHWVEENDAEIWAIREDEISTELDDLGAQEAAYYAQRAPMAAAGVPF